MKIRAPSHLSKAAAAWFITLATEYGITDAGGVATLTQAADAWDRCRQARELITKDGSVLADRFGQKVPHPAIRIETSARAQVLQALKQLNLDIEPLKATRGGVGGFRGENA